jgi:prepilin-type N-terminal cleavage/methylation domain-containing protein
MKIFAALRNERGFTLIETMVSLLLMSILFIGVWGIFGTSYTFWRQAEYRVDMYDSLQISFDRMGRELMYARQPDAAYPASGYPGGVLVNSNDSHLYFQIDGTPTEAVPNPVPKRIHYYCSSNNLYRQENYYSPQPLASDIQGVVFTYYDGAGEVVNPTSSEQARSIRQVKILLTAQKQNSTLAPVVLVQKISLRAFE